METSKTIHELDHLTVMQMLRSYSKKIALLAQRGEPLSVKLKRAYEDFYDHQGDSALQANFRDLLRDWMRQHLETTSRLELARKFGYLVDGEGPSEGPKIVTLQ
jgi:hypothetical protein